MIRVYPKNDDRRHTRGITCWCNPEVLWINEETGLPYENGPIVGHNSSDCREVVENMIDEMLAPNKTWVLDET